MSYRIKLLWKVIVKLNAGGLSAVNEKSNALFNKQGGKTFLRTLGGGFKTSYAPVVLKPTDIFHQAIFKFCKENNIDGSRFPVDIDLGLIGQRVRLNVKFNLYDNFVCATFSLDEFTVPTGVDFIKLQALSSHRVLYKFVSRVLAIVIYGDAHAKDLPQTPKIFPCIRIVSQSSSVFFERKKLVEIVTRHSDAVHIVDAVIQKNARHQIDETLLLFDKQGIAGYVPFGVAVASEQAHRQRFANATSMIEYAAMLQRQLGSCQWLPEDIRRAIHMPDSAVPSSVSSRYMWALAVEEFLLLCELKNWESESVGSLKGCILLVTVNVIESKAVRKAFLGATQCSPHTIDINGFKYEHLGVLGGYEIIHVISGMGATGIEGAQETVRRSIDDVNPNVVLMVGIAFGVDDKKQKIGDILVSRQVFLYESQRRNKDSTIVNRGDTVTASPMLLGWASHAEVNWGDEKPSIHTGLILSGEKLVDNLSFRDGLVSMASEAIGGEMEAAGVYVACQNSKVEWLVIKAICDWANGEKNRNKIANQKEAAKWAAEFAVCIVGGK